MTQVRVLGVEVPPEGRPVSLRCGGFIRPPPRMTLRSLSSCRFVPQSGFPLYTPHCHQCLLQQHLIYLGIGLSIL